MNTMQRKKFKSVGLTTILFASLTVLMAGCDEAEQTADSTENQSQINQLKENELLLGHVAEFDNFTLRANVSPTEFLPDTMLQEHGIEARQNLIQLNVVILEKLKDHRLVPVSAKLKAYYENQVGNIRDIDMRVFKVNDSISYMGMLDVSVQHIFRFFIEAQPEGIDEPLEMNFKVKLPEPDSDQLQLFDCIAITDGPYRLKQSEFDVLEYIAKTCPLYGVNLSLCHHTINLQLYQM